MDWDDVNDILFDGTEEEIDAVKCPECGGDLTISYFPKTRNMEILCPGCTVVRAHGTHYEPNFYVFARKKANREAGAIAV